MAQHRNKPAPDYRTGDPVRGAVVDTAMIALPDDDPSPYDWEDEMTEPEAVRAAVLANRRRDL